MGRVFRLNGKVTIPRPAKDVLAFLANVENEKKWQKDIVHIELVGGKAASKGAQYERVQLVGGRNIKTVNEITDMAPGQLTFQGKGKVIEYKLVYKLGSSGASTNVEMELEGEMLGFASMFEGIAADELRNQIPENLERLKAAMSA